MSSNRTQQIKAAFCRLREADSAERARLLTSNPGEDRDLWRIAAAMLETSERLPATFLEPPAEVVDAAERARTRSEQLLEHVESTAAGVGDAGKRVGRYELLRPLGEGGFGMVWEAEQHEPVHRLVALKLIKRGMDTDQIIRRFAAERQSLAVLDHPSITKVLDAGSTDDGRPYFVMELVIGLPIVEYCRDRNPSPDSILRVFELICRAIHHAHRRGIVHRDIKPSNILVTECDGEPTPRIIDFGIAKAMDQAARPTTDLTWQRQVVGTPAYMAPEQIEPNRGPVDARSDIYSLGVVLYELFTDSPLREAAADSQLALDAIARRLDEPLPASRRVSRLAGLPSDLDWIILKCIEVEPDRRYESALALAEDIRRFLADEPVQASPPGFTYPLRKFCQRHRVAVGAAACVLVALLLLGSAGFFWTSWKNQELDESNAELRVRNAAYLREKSVAERALQDVERLSDAHLLASLEVRANEDLWPAVPAKSALMTQWIAEAEVLVARLDQHRSELRAVRARALPAGEPGVATLRRPAAATTDRARFDDPWPGAPRQDDATESPDTEPPERKEWAFGATKDAWRHWLLEDLVENLEAFADPQQGTLPSMRRRLAFARELRERSLTRHERAWESTIAAIRESPLYPTLRERGFDPQLGLVPLGADPKSGLLEFLDLATHDGPIPERDVDGRIPLADTIGIVLVLIPGGTFLMGAQADDEAAPNYDSMASKNEGPVHEERVEPFLLGKFEMTQAQWVRLENGTNPSYFYAGGYASGLRVTALHPVEQVRWSEGAHVLRKAGMRYPTEAQWEYATRAGTGSTFFFGADGAVLPLVANFADASAKKVTTRVSNFDDGFAYTAPIGSFGANPFGLHDVYGNVAEWCSDLFVPHYATDRPLREPLSKADLEDSRRRVVRGGAFNLLPTHTRSARRHALRGDSIRASVGLRAAREIQRSQ